MFGWCEVRGGVGFVLEALQLPRVEHGGERQHLERDAAAERNLLGLVDDAHAAAADLAEDAEVAEDPHPTLSQREREFSTGSASGTTIPRQSRGLSGGRRRRRDGRLDES